MTALLPLEIIEAGVLQPRPWSNGMGLTKEIAFGGGKEWGSGEDFGWRLSLAELNGSAAFSEFGGIDRIFTMASAGPARLVVDNVPTTLRLGQQSHFPGECPVAVDLPDGRPQAALNLMTRRHSCTGSVHVVEIQGRLFLEPTDDVVLATVLSGAVTLPDGRTLTALTTMQLRGQAVELVAEGCLLAIARVRRL
jgi:environmental stress-induced protein Ves